MSVNDAMEEVNQEKDLKKKLGGHRIIIAMVIGLGISAYLLISSLNDTKFIIDENNKGNYEWVDANDNGRVEFGDPDEFKEVKPGSGKYRESTYKDALKLIDWTVYSFFWLFMALLMMAVRDFAYMGRIRVLTEKALSWRQSFFVIMIWEFASALSPGVVGGTGVAMFILNREGIAMGKSTAIIIITALMDNLFYILMIPLVFLFISQDQLFPENTESFLAENSFGIFWIGYSIIFVISFILFLGIFKFPKLIKNIIVGIFSLPFLRKWKEYARETGNDVVISSKELKGKPYKFWLQAYGYTLMSWTGRYLVINFILMAFINIGLFEHALVFGRQLVMWLIMLISPTPGGSGIAEIAFSGFLSEFTGSLVLVSSLAFIWRLITYFPYLFIGTFLLPRWLRMTSNKKKG